MTLSSVNSGKNFRWTKHAGIFANKSWERLILQSLMELLPHDSAKSQRFEEFFFSNRLKAERTIAKQVELEFEAFLSNQIYSLLNSHLIQIWRNSVKEKLSEHFKFSFLFIIFGARGTIGIWCLFPLFSQRRTVGNDEIWKCCIARSSWDITSERILGKQKFLLQKNCLKYFLWVTKENGFMFNSDDVNSRPSTILRIHVLKSVYVSHQLFAVCVPLNKWFLLHSIFTSFISTWINPPPL